MLVGTRSLTFLGVKVTGFVFFFATFVVEKGLMGSS